MKLQAAVFFGGRSVEHEVSVITGVQAMAALSRERYDVVPVYVTKDGAFYTGEGYDALESYKNIPELIARGRQVSFARAGGRVCVQPVLKKLFGADKPAFVDLALPVMHGTFGEDGSIQGFLELLGLPYTGSDVLSSAVCMDKPASKALLRAGGLPVLDDVTVDSARYYKNPEAALSALETRFPYPLIAKPANLGSSVGVSKARDREALREALELAFSFAPRVLVEPAVAHLREINCAVLGDAQKARASVCEEPIARDDILSYTDKYQSSGGKQDGLSGQKRVIPADITPEQTAHVQKLAAEAFAALGCSGVARVDFLWDTQADVFYVNELNTIPGSLAFYLWEKSGLPFEGLMDALIELAFARARARGQLTFTSEGNLLAGAKLGSKGKS